MIHTASLATSEGSIGAILDRIADDPVIGERTVDAHEAAPGRWAVLVYFEEAPDSAERVALRRIGKAVGVTFVVSRLPDTDWVAKSLEGLAPVRAGRFLVHGRHDRARRRPNDIAIEIEAAEAFGTGHHGTTAGCLLAIDTIARTRPVRNVLDIGTGTGVLAIAAAKRSRAPVLASDIDPIAVRAARANAHANGVGRLVRAIVAAGLSRREFADAGPFDLILANILAGPLLRMAPSVRRHLASPGSVVLSGLLPEQRARMVSAYRRQGLRLVGDRILDGWLTLVMEC